MTQTIYSGYGAYEKLRGILKKFSPKKIFLVTGKTSYTQSGAERLLGDIIKKFDYIRFCDFESNPKLKDVQKGIDVFRTQKCDFIIGVGGGTVMDIAKAVSFLVNQKGAPEEYIKNIGSIQSKSITSIIIPTTSGTGSESTHFSVIYIGKTKYSLAHYSIMPDIVILDPTFTESLSEYITAYTGMDALCQGIESFWSVQSTQESRMYSKKAITLAIKNIVKSVKNPDKKSREDMLMASNWAGKAINIAKTTAAHAVSYPLTSYFNIPHGHAVGLTLPYFIGFNSSVSRENIQDRRGIENVKNMIHELIDILGEKTPSKAQNKLLVIMQEIKLVTKLSKLNIQKDDIQTVVKNAFDPERVKNNPRKISKQELRVILEQII